MKKNSNIVKILRTLAKKAASKAYSPYSKIEVGAAILFADGRKTSGCNIENASYGATVCAERVAIWKGIAEKKSTIKHVYVYSKGGWPPCGECLQVIAEFATSKTLVTIGNPAGKEKTLPISEVLPLAFTPEHLTNK